MRSLSLVPIVQNGISDKDAEHWLHQLPETLERPRESEGVDSIAFHDNSPNGPLDRFEQALERQAIAIASHGNRTRNTSYRVLQLDEETLRSLHPNDVFIIKYPTMALGYRYFRNMIPEIRLFLCCHCRRFFHEEDFELVMLKNGHCPCCRYSEFDPPN